MKNFLNNLRSLLNSEELQEHLTDYLDCDKVEFLLNYDGHNVYTLNLSVINIYDDAETASYSETFEFSFTKQGLVTSLLYRFSPEYEDGRFLHASMLGDKLTKYLNARLPNKSGLSEYDLNTLDRRTLYPRTMIRKKCDNLIDSEKTQF